MSRNPPIPAGVRALEPLRVVVVAADPLVRAALGRALEEEADGPVRLVDDAGDAEVALWDAAGDPEAARLPERIPALALVADEDGSTAALSAGARGAVLRSADGAGLWAALVAVLHGHTVIDGAFAVSTLTPSAAAGAGVDALTAREREVLGLIARGLSNPQIAARLSISEHTAKFHAGQILAKLGAATRTEAVVIAVRRGLVAL
ncbi:MAG TPA: response regulator transcription factor [Kofleriaceae bacterium]|nr:response regulator transcription factor [Kofleriaceae bacterium]